MQPFEIIGHRGAAGLAPENTLPSFHRAWSLGCRWVELDVHKLTGAPDTLAVIHDDTLDRTTDRTGTVAALSPGDLAQVDAGGAPIPTLGEVYAQLLAHMNAQENLQDTGGYGINVELKGKGTAQPVAAFLESYPHTEEVATLVSSFDHRELFDFRRHDAVTPVAPLLSRWRDDIFATAASLEARTVNLSRRCATAKRVTALRDAGYDVLVYTVNDADAARRLRDLGVRGVFSDYPDRLLPLTRE